MHKTRSMLLYADNESSIHTVTHNESEVDRLRAGRCAIVWRCRGAPESDVT